jgi:hypothetical protein
MAVLNNSKASFKIQLAQQFGNWISNCVLALRRPILSSLGYIDPFVFGSGVSIIED